MFGWLRRKEPKSEPLPIRYPEGRLTRYVLIPGKNGYHICGSVEAIHYALRQTDTPR